MYLKNKRGVIERDKVFLKESLIIKFFKLLI